MKIKKIQTLNYLTQLAHLFFVGNIVQVVYYILFITLTRGGSMYRMQIKRLQKKKIRCIIKKNNADTIEPK